MPRKAKPDDPAWIDLSADEKRLVKAAMRRLAKTRDQKDDWDPYAIASPEAQMKALSAYYRGKGPHMTFRDSYFSKVASEVFEKLLRRELN